MNSSDSGDVTGHFKNYSRQANRDLIERAFNGTDFLRGVPANLKDGYASYPEKFPCTSGSQMVVPEPRHIADAVAQATLLDAVFPLYYIYKRLASS
jgi:hypothetical protein